MIRLFGRRGSKPTFDAPIEPDEPFTAVGDIHGCDRLLCNLLDRIESRPDRGRLIFVGDYCDRGEESANVHSRLISLSKMDSQAIFLKGNHEQMLLDFLDDPMTNGAFWMRHGGLQTCASYGVAPPSGSASEAEWYEARDRLQERLGEAENWLRELPLMWQNGNVAVVHAAADPHLPMTAQNEHTLLWGHPEFGSVSRDDGIWVAFGHVITDSPVAGLGLIPTDTGAYATGVLSAACVSSGNVEYVST